MGFGANVADALGIPVPVATTVALVSVPPLYASVAVVDAFGMVLAESASVPLSDGDGMMIAR